MATVIGGGVSGLTTAVVLRRAGIAADVLTDRPVDELVSWVAGAIWTIPDHAGNEPMAGWAIRSREVFATLAGRPETGVRPLDVRELHRTDPGRVWWETTVWVERLAPPPGYAAQFGVRGFIIEPPVYLEWLRAELEALGGRVRHRPVAGLDEIEGDVVNATGLAAGELVGDRAVYPIRGQVVALDTTAVDVGLADESDPDRITYLYPRSSELIVGGTRQPGVDRLDVDEAETERILADAASLEPRVAGAPVIEVRVGLRPGRDVPRVEAETVDGRRVVHNYGHAGKGYLLSWGCADRVLELLTT